MPNRTWLPKLESITVHPAERWNLDEQLPTALVYGEPLPDDVTIWESELVTVGTLRLHFADGTDVACTLGPPPSRGPQRWIKCDPATGTPYGPATPPTPTEGGC